MDNQEKKDQIMRLHNMMYEFIQTRDITFENAKALFTEKLQPEFAAMDVDYAETLRMLFTDDERTLPMNFRLAVFTRDDLQFHSCLKPLEELRYTDIRQGREPMENLRRLRRAHLAVLADEDGRLLVLKSYLTPHSSGLITSDPSVLFDID